MKEGRNPDKLLDMGMDEQFDIKIRKSKTPDGFRWEVSVFDTDGKRLWGAVGCLTARTALRGAAEHIRQEQWNQSDNPTREELITALQKLGAETGTSPTQMSWSAWEARPCAYTTCAKAFGGSWSSALQAAGFKVRKGRPPRYDDEVLLGDIRRWEQEHDSAPGADEWDAHAIDDGRASSAAYLRRWGRWSAAVQAAGVEPKTLGGQPRHKSKGEARRARLLASSLKPKESA